MDLTLDGQDRSLFCTVELVYAEDGGKACTITLKEPAYSSHMPFPYIPADAPAGGYDLVITEHRYGYTWRYNHILEITENPDAPRYVFHTDIEDVLTVSRSSKESYCFTAIVENRMMDFTLPEGGRFSPSAGLTMMAGDAPAATVLCKDMSPANVTEIRTVRTGQMGTCRYELILTPDTPCGLYDLTLSYGGESVTLSQVVQVVE